MIEIIKFTATHFRNRDVKVVETHEAITITAEDLRGVTEVKMVLDKDNNLTEEYGNMREFGIESCLRYDTQRYLRAKKEFLITEVIPEIKNTEYRSTLEDFVEFTMDKAYMRNRFGFFLYKNFIA